MNKHLVLLLSCLMLNSACKKDPCKDVLCQNGGACVEGDCECPPDFEGKNCEYLSVAAYLGTYTTSYSGCFTASPMHTVSVSAISNEPEMMIFSGLGDYACPGAAQLLVRVRRTAAGFSIPEQNTCAGAGFSGYTWSGQGVRQLDTLRLQFTVTYPDNGTVRQDICSAKMVRE